MRKGLTEIVFIIDCSKSMEGNKQKVVAEFNRLLGEYKEIVSEGFVTTIMYNERSKIFHDRLNIGTVEPLTEEKYVLSGKPALIDAIGLTIKHISTIQKYARIEDKPEKTIIVLITDGKEEGSRIYTHETIEKSINQKIAQFGWEFIYPLTSLYTVFTALTVGKGIEDNVVEDEIELTEYVDELLRIFARRNSEH